MPTGTDSTLRTLPRLGGAADWGILRDSRGELSAGRGKRRILRDLGSAIKLLKPKLWFLKPEGDVGAPSSAGAVQEPLLAGHS